MEEIWVKIPNHEFYEVSTYGNVRSISRSIPDKNGRILHYKGKLLKCHDNGLGYKKIIYKDGTKEQEYVHRLVARLFIPNPLNKPCVNHIDNNPSNNHFTNLEWVTMQENTEWMIKQGRFKRTQQWLDHLHESLKGKYKAVKGTNINTGKTIYFESVNSVRTSGFLPSCVCVCCKHKNGVTQHKGYKWEYISNEEYIYGKEHNAN